MPTFAAHELSVETGNQRIYCGLDSALTFEIDGVRQRQSAEAQSPNAQVYDFELGLQAPAMEMMLRGFRVDPDELLRATRELESKLERTKFILDQLSHAVWDRGVNFNSGTQLKDLFYSHMGIRPITKRVNGVVTTPMDRDHLEKLDGYYYARPFVNAVLLARDLAGSLKVLKTEIDEDWRWRCSYNIGGTKEGRWSSSKSGIGTGSNVQNITEDLRRIFIADSGFKLVGIDREQTESRDVGWFCGTILGDWSYLDACESGDLHTTVTKMVHPEWAWTGDKRKDRALAERPFYRMNSYRQTYKKLGHATNYLGQPHEISRQTKIPVELIKTFQGKYFDAFPCIPRMHTWIAKEIQTKGYLVNAFGRRRDFFDRTDTDDTLKSAVAYMFASATADALNLGLWRLWRRMGTRIQILSQLHDAAYFQFPESEDEATIVREAKKWMSVTLVDPQGTRRFTTPLEPVSGWNWAHRFKLDEAGNKIEWNARGLDSIGAKR